MLYKMIRCNAHLEQLRPPNDFRQKFTVGIRLCYYCMLHDYDSMAEQLHYIFLQEMLLCGCYPSCVSFKSRLVDE